MPTPLPSAPPDAKKSIGPRLMLIAAIFVGVLVLLFGMFSKPLPERPAEPSAVRATQARAEPPFTQWMLVSKFLELQSTNQVAAETEAVGENKYLLGQVSMVRKEIAGDPYLLLGNLPFVRASFMGAETPVDLKTVGSFEHGDLVGLRCKGDGKALMMFSFTRCEIVWVAKDTDPLNFATSVQLCSIEALQLAFDGGSPSYGAGYFNFGKVKASGLSPNEVEQRWMAALAKIAAQLQEQVRTENIARIPCGEPELWAVHQCDGEKTDECSSPQMKQFTKFLLK